MLDRTITAWCHTWWRTVFWQTWPTSSVHALSTRVRYGTFVHSWPWRRLKQLLCPLWGAGLTTATACYGTTEHNLDRPQRVHNTLTCVVCWASRSAGVPDLLQQLHWMPVRERVWFKFKLAVTTFKIKHSGLVCRLTFMRTYTTTNLQERCGLPLHTCFNDH